MEQIKNGLNAWKYDENLKGNQQDNQEVVGETEKKLMIVFVNRRYLIY